jgi:hypothetical protein
VKQPRSCAEVCFSRQSIVKKPGISPGEIAWRKGSRIQQLDVQDLLHPRRQSLAAVSTQGAACASRIGGLQIAGNFSLHLRLPFGPISAEMILNFIAGQGLG